MREAEIQRFNVRSWDIRRSISCNSDCRAERNSWIGRKMIGLKQKAPANGRGCHHGEIYEFMVAVRGTVEGWTVKFCGVAA